MSKSLSKITFIYLLFIYRGPSLYYIGIHLGSHQTQPHVATMANWLLDYIEMTEYIPSELREQLTSIRELDLQVHNAMDELERDIKQFFAKINTLTPQERQTQYELFLNKCEVATRAASDKVKVADKLHDLVEKSMRLLDQGLEKLKEDLLDGDKGYIVEDLEKKSQELDEQLRIEHEAMMKRQSKIHQLNHQAKSHRFHSESNHLDLDTSQNGHNLPPHSMPAQNSTNNHVVSNHRSRNNSTGTNNSNISSTERIKKRERKRLNSTMSIFNRNSRTDDDSSSQTFLSSPLTPDHISGLQNSNKSLSDVVCGSTNGSLTLKGMMVGNGQQVGVVNDKIKNGNNPLAGAKQPILTAIDAAHAVSPNATNSDKLVLFSSNSANGDNYNLTQQLNNHRRQTHTNLSNMNQLNPYQRTNQVGEHLIPTVGLNLNDSAIGNSSAISKSDRHHNKVSGGLFSGLPLSSRHDPIMVAASQAINATQNMTPGRRTSSLKASYAAVNSGRLQSSNPNQQALEQADGTSNLVHEAYCKCKSHIQGSDMIACDNRDCKIEWFHYECVGITTPPEGEWYCEECRLSLGVMRGTKQAKLESLNVT